MKTLQFESCDVPAGPFLMGSTDADGMAYGDEKPQHEVNLPAYRVSQYLVTNAQYAAFVEDGGYTEKWRACWTEAGWRWKDEQSGPTRYGGVFDLPNHPVVGVSWYEAVAFCSWLTERLRGIGEMDADEVVRLPSEREWEKAARGTEGRIYPWGDEADPERANYADTGIGSTSAVGCFPGGASPCGALDMAGNVWEWCATKWQKSYADYWDDDDLEGDSARVVRGGAFLDPERDVRAAYRDYGVPDSRNGYLGFRVVVVLQS